jgi:D-alanyl-D-alanine carboxypeptidase
VRATDTSSEPRHPSRLEKNRNTLLQYPPRVAAMRLLLALLLPLALTVGCSSDEEPEADAVVQPVPPRQWKQMVRVGMVRPECPIQRRGQLRRVEVNHYDFQGEVRRGHLIVNEDVAHSVARVFTRLFEKEFPIRRMRSLEAYDGNSNASLRADNTAAFNCRRAGQINAPFLESPHANGRAVDINPRENPWMDLRCDCWMPSPKHAPRRPGQGKILRGGLVWRTFRAEGWIWQDIDVADYMHFDTGYPSKPYKGPKRQPSG